MKDFVYFCSGSAQPFCKLSNFSAAQIVLLPDDPTVQTLRKIRPELIGWLPASFSLAEHLWKALQALDKASFDQFQADGILGSLTLDAFRLFYPIKEAASKLKYWSKQSNVGILAKLAGHPQRWKQLDLHMEFKPERLEPALEQEIWTTILYFKYSQNAVHRQVLLETGSKRLIEFDRLASASHWSAQYVEDVLVGNNAMGQYMEIVRSKF